MAIGRPSSYKPEYCELVIKLGKQGASVAKMAVECGVTREGLRGWEERYPAFADALARAREESLAWYQERGKEGMDEGSDFNDRAFKFMAMNLFPEDMKERREVAVTGLLASINIDRLPDRLVARIADGEDPEVVLAEAAAEGMRRLSAGSDADAPESRPEGGGEIQEAEWSPVEDDPGTEDTGD